MLRTTRGGAHEGGADAKAARPDAGGDLPLSAVLGKLRDAVDSAKRKRGRRAENPLLAHDRAAWHVRRHPAPSSSDADAKVVRSRRYRQMPVDLCKLTNKIILPSWMFPVFFSFKKSPKKKGNSAQCQKMNCGYQCKMVWQHHETKGR